jgi:hypothetical protein
MANFKWLRNPTLANTKTTWYVSHRGLDSGDGGDGSATNPFRTIAQVTSVATAGDNIMLDDGIWSQQRTLNNRAFIWWGNGRTEIDDSVTDFGIYDNDVFNYFNRFIFISSDGLVYYYCHYCNYVRSKPASVPPTFNGYYCNIYNMALMTYTYVPSYFHNCNIINCTGGGVLTLKTFYNNVIIGPASPSFSGIGCDYNNYTTLSIPTTNGANSHSINNASTGQTVADYFNNYDLGDYTAKVGSANLGAGYNKHDIGFSLGLTFHATDSVFTEVGGATLRNVIYENECFKIAQRDKAVTSATNTSVTLYIDAETDDDYYNGLIIGIIEGAGAGQMRTITDYDGTTKTATVDTWDTNPDATSRYTISGLIISAQKDFGKSYKIARNHLFANFGYNELAPSIWTEFMAINPLVSSFGLKYSDFDDLSTRDWVYFGANGQTLYNGTYGDANDSYTFANGKPIHIRYAQLQIPLIFQFE